jgi:hypothetical protein
MKSANGFAAGLRKCAMTRTKCVVSGQAWSAHAGVPVVFAIVLGVAVAQAPVPADPYRNLRLNMVRDQIEARGVKNPDVLAAMRTVPRELFVPESVRPQAYAIIHFRLAPARRFLSRSSSA